MLRVSDFQKVTAKWDPAGACTFDLKEAPVFHPSYEMLCATGSFGDGSSEPNNADLGFESLNRSASGWNLNCISSLPGSLLLTSATYWNVLFISSLGCSRPLLVQVALSAPRCT